MFLAVFFTISSTQAATIVWAGFINTTANADQKWIDLLTAQGHTVITQGTWQEITDADVATMNRADLVIVSANMGTSTNLNGDCRGSQMEFYSKTDVNDARIYA